MYNYFDFTLVSYLKLFAFIFIFNINKKLSFSQNVSYDHLHLPDNLKLECYSTGKPINESKLRCWEMLKKKKTSVFKMQQRLTNFVPWGCGNSHGKHHLGQLSVHRPAGWMVSYTIWNNVCAVKYLTPSLIAARIRVKISICLQCRKRCPQGVWVVVIVIGMKRLAILALG